MTAMPSPRIPANPNPHNHFPPIQNRNPNPKSAATPSPSLPYQPEPTIQAYTFLPTPNQEHIAARIATPLLAPKGHH